MTHPELGPPPPLPEDGLRVVALGGLGEIGRNMTVFEYGGRLLIVDCGVLFPEDHQPGVDLILPDFEWIRDRLDQVEAVVLTHGHEDHIGAVPYLLREQAGPPADRVAADPGLRRGQAPRAPDQAVHARGQGGRSSSRSGRSGCEFVAVNHSIPDALAVAIRTPSGQLVLHTGDFKMDQLPLDGRITDLRGVRAAGRGGRRPLPHRLHQRRGARLRRAPSARSSRSIDRVFSRASKRDHRGVLRVARAPHPAGARHRRRARAARWPSSGARWCATWESLATWAT